MGFLAPWFLAGLALIGVPLLVHLTQRDKASPTAFPSLMFVRRLPQPTTRRRRLRDLPLLALRVLALILLAGAFARPLFDRARAALPNAGGRELVVLLDRSYSMGAPGRWERAKEAARQAIAALGPNDRGTVVLFDASPVVAAERGTGASLGASIDSAHVGSGATRYGPALALASRLLAASPLVRREALVVSDFQRAGWRGDASTKLPSGARLTWFDVGGTSVADVAVAGVDLRRTSGDGGERVSAVARVIAPSGAGARSVPVTLAVNGRDVQRVTARVAPGAAASVTFDAVPVPPGWSRATVRVSGDSLPADDTLHFTFARGQTMRALLVRGASRDANGELYLRRALGVGDAPPIGVDVAQGAALGASAIAGHGVIVLHDAPVRGAAGKALADWVQAGGGLVVALGEGSNPEAWDPAVAALLPGRPGAVVDRTDIGGTRVASYERAHPIFVPFAAPHSGDLGAPRVLRRRDVTLAPDAQVLARFDDGAPALIERSAGRGRVVMWTSTLDNWWTDLPLDPVYVPLVRQLAMHAARFVPAAPFYAVGQTVDPAVLLGAESAQWIVDAPNGRRVRLDTGLASLAVLSEPGFYRLRPEGSSPDAGALIAANVDPTESDTARVAPAEIAQAVTDSVGAPVASSAPVETRVERESRQSLWWYLLVTMLVLLVAETFVANRRPRLAR